MQTGPSTAEAKEATKIRSIKAGLRPLASSLLLVLLVVLASLLIRTFAFQTIYIPSKSMKPTLFVRDRIVVDKMSVDFGTINIGDVIVFKAPQDVAEDCDDPVTDLVKRVVGVPGDHVTSKGNTIYVNGVRLRENWTHWEPLGPAIGNVTVPANRYFVMGDNHNNSCDSRTWGTVPRSDIIGKVFLRFWPLSRFSWL
jgi:signal peptidase I